jgi:hypothetical protein
MRNFGPGLLEPVVGIPELVHLVLVHDQDRHPLADNAIFTIGTAATAGLGIAS